MGLASRQEMKIAHIELQWHPMSLTHAAYSDVPIDLITSVEQCISN